MKDQIRVDLPFEIKVQGQNLESNTIQAIIENYMPIGATKDNENIILAKFKKHDPAVLNGKLFPYLTLNPRFRQFRGNEIRSR
jgi:hypothetical protein